MHYICSFGHCLSVPNAEIQSFQYPTGTVLGDSKEILVSTPFGHAMGTAHSSFSQTAGAGGLGESVLYDDEKKGLYHVPKDGFRRNHG